MAGMASSRWPLFELRLITERLVLRPLQDTDFMALLAVVDAGIHDEDNSPFMFPWTDGDPEERARRTMQFWWGTRANWSVDNWVLGFGVFYEDRFVGVQDVTGTHFPVMKEVQTGSWLGREFQGQGIGKEMRAAVLSFAFDSLGADIARSEALVTNVASRGVSKSVGYQENGSARIALRGQPLELVRYQLTRTDWEARGLPSATVENLEPCLVMFGM